MLDYVLDDDGVRVLYDKQRVAMLVRLDKGVRLDFLHGKKPMTFRNMKAAQDYCVCVNWRSYMGAKPHTVHKSRSIPKSSGGFPRWSDQ